MKAHLKDLLMDGFSTRPARGEQIVEISPPDVSLVDTVMTDLFSWEAISEHGSDHLLLLLIFVEDNKMEREHACRRPNYPKED